MRKHKIRITSLSMSAIDIMMTLGGGNPGALSVLAGLLKQTTSIDPDSALGEFGALLLLDTFGVYESDIWVLFKDVCDQDIVTMVAMLRSVQLGITSEQDMKDLMANSTRIDGDELIAKVQMELPNFGVQVKINGE